MTEEAKIPVMNVPGNPPPDYTTITIRWMCRNKSNWKAIFGANIHTHTTHVVVYKNEFKSDIIMRAKAALVQEYAELKDMDIHDTQYNWNTIYMAVGKHNCLVSIPAAHKGNGIVSLYLEPNRFDVEYSM